MFDWFQIFNTDDFEALGLVSRNLTLFLLGYGEKEILITKGNTIALTYDGVLLPVEFAEKNPYVRDGYAVYKDADNNVFLGIEVEE